jgi:hypothetical protein
MCECRCVCMSVSVSLISTTLILTHPHPLSSSSIRPPILTLTLKIIGVRYKQASCRHSQKKFFSLQIIYISSILCTVGLRVRRDSPISSRPIPSVPWDLTLLKNVPLDGMGQTCFAYSYFFKNNTTFWYRCCSRLFEWNRQVRNKRIFYTVCG